MSSQAAQWVDTQEAVLISGFGGQGIILAGRLLAHAAMAAGKQVTFLPAYGAEVRGGASNCTVVISSQPIACPVVAYPDCVIAMSTAAACRFASHIRPGGTLLTDSCMIDGHVPVAHGVTVVRVPASRMAAETGNTRAANMVLLGCYLELRPVLTVAQLCRVLPDVLAPRHHHMIPKNIEAIEAGRQFARQIAPSEGVPAIQDQ